MASICSETKNELPQSPKIVKNPHLIKSFEREKSVKGSSELNLSSILNSSKSSEGPDELNSSFLKLEETLAENILLKRELRGKIDEIISLRGKIADAHSRSSEIYTENSENNSLFLDESFDEKLAECSALVLQLGSESEKSAKQSDLLRQVYNSSLVDIEELGAHESLSQSLLNWAEANKDNVIERVGVGGVAAKDLAVGGLSGFATALLFKKFGKVAITALGGGILLLQLAHQKGYVVVNWSHIYRQLETSAIEIESESEDWLTQKVKKIKKWSTANSNIVLGFIGGFIYKTYA